MLNQQIRDTIQQFREALPAELAAKIEQGAGEISALDIIGKALNVGASVPDFSLTNQNGDLRKLADYLAQGPLVLTFYRGLWCPFCNLQLKAYNDRLADIEATGAKLVAVTPEKPDALQILKDGGAPEDFTDMAPEATDFDVLFDDGGDLSEKFGLQFNLPKVHQDLLQNFNIDVEALTGNDRYAFPDPATYVIDQSGKITWAFVPNNYRKRAEVDDILKAIAQLS
ncbi:Peroxiredoxin [Pseudovibrio denitrificans]|uniref:thioredoxin-dependent peroxiredoxin n=1 Tax=Pseudovibrio denitrificans TaxID=258256 RepID=A0A1I7CK75_9HYPH|nr:peroxiredoxin-like family protein [Pseudovibrio denitrificans]SFT99812.1 Peroxiredoxin [Pseudovibrio denitrificans]